MRRLVLLLAAMALALVVASGVASADPINSKKAPIATFVCEGGEQVTVTFLLNNSVIFNVVDTTGSFVLTRVEGTATFTETGEVEPFDFTIGQGKKTGLQDSLTTCTTTFTFTFEDPELGTVTVGDFTFTGFFVPRKG